MRRLITMTVLTFTGVLSIAVARAQEDATIIRLEKVKDALYIVTVGRGAGEEAGISGNTTVFITDTGVVLVDTKYPRYGKAILDQVKSVTNKPVTVIINTHTHADHTSGNSEFPNPVEFVDHEKKRKNITSMNKFTENN